MISKKNLPGWLMYISVGLLLLFQVYWLQKEYDNAHRRLHREIGVVLRENFMKRQMALLFKDSSISPLDRVPSFMIDRKNSGSGKRDSSQKTTIITLKPDANTRAVFTIDSNVQKEDQKYNGHPRRGFAGYDGNVEEPLGPNLTVRATISEAHFKNPGSADSIFREALEKTGLPFEFTVKKAEEDSNRTSFRIRGTNNVKLREEFSIVFAELDFGNAFPYVIQRIYGQIIISLVMTSIVIIAFYLMFRSLKQQQRLAVLKNDFISNMTHELKTPVATVSVAIEALKNFNALKDPVRTKEYLDISSLELNRLSMLIDKVLRINMFEADKLDLSIEPTELNEMAKMVLQTVGIQAEKIGATIIFKEPTEPLWVKGDRLHLMSVLYNLLDNALKYHSDQPRIEVKLYKNDFEILMAVKDNGPGIAEEYIPRIFDKFFRVPTGNRHDIKGYGLGLSYVSDIIQKHGGSIVVESSPGNGCNFIVKLPALS